MEFKLREKTPFNRFLSTCKDYIFPNRILDRHIGSNSFLRHSTAVVHVGAHDGREARMYARYNLDVLWIEAIPEVFSQLQKNIARFNKQKAVNALVTDKDGKKYDFNISEGSGASSSIFQFNVRESIWPEIKTAQQIKLISRMLDNIIAEDGRRFDALVMDTQGSELLVLKGSPSLLPQLKFIKTEAADIELYKGGTTTEELTSFLHGSGFKLRGRFNFRDTDKCCELIFFR